jgi:AmmeMemoRadiSam system protein A
MTDGSEDEGEPKGHLADPAAFARRCVEAAVAACPAPPWPSAEPFTRRAACFVSIKQRGQLRGCIGTLTPAEPDLAHEIARNAASAAFHDPRFPPVTANELDGLSYSVDVLSPSEPTRLEELDPRRYGVIVSSGWRRGVLLPDLAGVDTVERQVFIALQKAGISPDEPFEAQRFTVTRYLEGEPEGRESGAYCGGDDA